MERDWYLGVDAGNTKTIAVIADETGAIRGWGRGGCGDIYARGTDAAFAQWCSAISAALEMAGIGAENIIASGFSMAGADWPEDFAFIEESVRKAGWGRMVFVVNDSIGGLAAGSSNGSGVAVILGTGAAIGARGTDGSIWHPSFLLRSFIHLDPAEDAVTAALYDEMGIGPATSLTPRVLQIYAVNTVEEAVHARTRRNSPTFSRSILLGAMYEEAEAGDGEVVRILGGYAKMCADFACLSAKRVGLSGPFPIVFSGGMLRHPSSQLRDAITRLVNDRYAEAYPVHSTAQPVIGALILAFESGGGSIAGELRAKLLDTVLPGELFDTAAP